jgi:hypothetical protein
MSRTPVSLVLTPQQITDLRARFDAKISSPDPVTVCVSWTGALTGTTPDGRGGYPELGNVAGHTLYAHRVSFYIHHGRWPNGQLHHECENRRCVAPEHLVETHHAEHMREHQRIRASRKPIFSVPPVAPAPTVPVEAA